MKLSSLEVVISSYIFLNNDYTVQMNILNIPKLLITYSGLQQTAFTNKIYLFNWACVKTAGQDK